MQMTPAEYNAYVTRLSPKSPLWKDCLNAFWIGGLICVIGQLIGDGIKLLDWGEDQTAAATSAVMIFLGALFTGLNLYDDVAKVAGAGTIVPDHWLCQFHCLSGNGVQVRGIGAGRGCENVFDCRTGSGLWHFS